MSFADHVLILKVLIGKNHHELQNLLNLKISDAIVSQTGQIWKRVQDYTIDLEIYPLSGRKKRMIYPRPHFFYLNVIASDGVYTLVIGGGGDWERDRLQK